MATITIKLLGEGAKMSGRVVTEDAIEERLTEITEEIERLEAERDALVDLLKSKGVDQKQFLTDAAGQEALFRETSKRSKNVQRPSPKTAVRHTVRNHPGWSKKQIVDRLEGIVDSDADDVRAVLYTALRRLEEEEEIVQIRDRMYPREHPRVKHVLGDVHDVRRHPRMRSKEEVMKSVRKKRRDSG